MQWITELLQRWGIARDARRHQHNLHHVRRTWLFSGTQSTRNGAPMDAGVTECVNCTLTEARERLADWYPRATVIHVDEINFIITFRVS